MPRGLRRQAVAAALLAGSVAIGAHSAPAADISAPFDVPAVAPEPNEDARWLTPDQAFFNSSAEPAVVSTTFPLLRIPAEPVPDRNASSEIRRQDQQWDQGKADSFDADVNLLSSATSGRKTTSSPEPIDDTKQSLTPRAFSGLHSLGDSSPQVFDHLPRLVFMTLVVLAACLGTLLLARRWLMKSGLVTETKRDARLKIVASLSVAPRSQLHIIRYDDRELLVGVDSRGLQQVQLMTPSFDAVLQTAEEQEAPSVRTEKPNELRVAPSSRRSFAAA